MGEKSFEGLKVFSATKALEREVLGEKITDWLKKNPGLEIVDKVITQSSDSEFHCLTITLFYNGSVIYNPKPEYTSKGGGYDGPGQQRRTG